MVLFTKRGKEWYGIRGDGIGFVNKNGGKNGTVFGGQYWFCLLKRGKEWYGIRGDSIGFVYKTGERMVQYSGGRYWVCLQNGVKNGTVFGGQYWFRLQNGGKNGTGSKLFRRSQQDLASFKGSRNIKFTKNV